MALGTRGKSKSAARDRRHARLRKKIEGTAARPRLVVTRSARHVFVQLVDDSQGVTVASASTLESDMRTSLKTGADTAAAAAVGKPVAERAIAAGIKDVVFDRGSFIYHGRIKALAEASREGGLNF